MNRPIPARTLGASGLRVTPIGLGLAGAGRPAYLGGGREEAPVQTAVDALGIAQANAVRIGWS